MGEGARGPFVHWSIGQLVNWSFGQSLELSSGPPGRGATLTLARTAQGNPSHKHDKEVGRRVAERWELVAGSWQLAAGSWELAAALWV
jgi:hypothetical protein